MKCLLVNVQCAQTLRLATSFLRQPVNKVNFAILKAVKKEEQRFLARFLALKRIQNQVS